MKIPDLDTTIPASEYLIPTIPVYGRLEGHPHTANFQRSMRAEVRDALWMLSRQWQLGEFRGEDAGSPAKAKVHLRYSPLTRFQAPGAEPEFFQEDAPLEAHAERLPIGFESLVQRNGENIQRQDISLDIRLLMGRQWMKLLEKAGVSEKAISYVKTRFTVTFEGTEPLILGHPRVEQKFTAAKKMVDGWKVMQALLQNSDPELSGEKIQGAKEKFIAWYDRLFYQPREEQMTWKPSQLEYEFNCIASRPDNPEQPVRLHAEEYYHGHLDWYNFDITSQKPLHAIPADRDTSDSAFTQFFLPTPVRFSGMPNTRWWTFEDSRTDLGSIRPDLTGLTSLLLMEFGLIYANDWFIFPTRIPVGTLSKVMGLAVTNSFGEHFWIEPASNKSSDEDWQRWQLFGLSKEGQQDKNTPAELSMLLLPIVPKIQESGPLEEIIFIRDEMANMVWGIEKTVSLPDGNTRDGGDAARELLDFYLRRSGASASEASSAANGSASAKSAEVKYQLMTAVPENWIPFIPVHTNESNRDIQLQRGAIPRILPGGIEKVRPRTSVLQEGMLDATPSPFYIYEEEILRAGVQLTRSFQRTRWNNGRTFVWLGMRKRPGRGEGSSGLAFDQAKDIPQSNNNDTLKQN